MNPSKIEEIKCISCNKCVEICFAGKIKKEEGKYKIMEMTCSECGHCIAICPSGAITAAEETALNFDAEKLKIEENTMANILRSRRSTRIYKKDPVSKETIKKLINVASYAPSGCNCQSWEFSVITKPETMAELVEMSKQFYSGVIKMSVPEVAEDKRAIKNEAVLEVLKYLVESLNEGKDNLFYKAPALVVVHADRNSITPQDNCCYALYNMVILAHTMGIGSCINGLITVAINGYKAMREKIGIPETNQAYAASTFGYPVHKFQRIPKRRDAKIKWF